MPLFFQHNINQHTRLAVWQITESEDFFLRHVPLQNNITHTVKRLQHLAGRYLLQHLYPNFPYHLIQIAQTRKPFIEGEPYHFSISHCSNYAAAIVSTDFRVGIDVEVITSKVEKIKHKFLHPDELRFINSRPAHKQTELLTILWGAKEAMYKWYGLGEVDFMQMMRTLPFAEGETGRIDCCFIKGMLQEKLTATFKLWHDISLVWIVSD